jgi:hypothetical protein
MDFYAAPPIDWRREREINRLPSIETQLITWIDAVGRADAGRCITLKRHGFRVYVRMSLRKLGDRTWTTLDIANVTVPQRFQRRGWFTAFRHLAERLNPWDATYYEAVINLGLRRHFQAAGLHTDGSDSFYVPTGQGAPSQSPSVS